MEFREIKLKYMTTYCSERLLNGLSGLSKLSTLSDTTIDSDTRVDYIIYFSSYRFFSSPFTKLQRAAR